MLIILLLIIIQLGDSFNSELYNKIQSLYLKDLVMVPQNINLEEATIMLNQAAIPFCIIAALAPMARALVDYIGKKKVLLISFLAIVIGGIICFFTDNWLLFLLGNAFVSFGCSMDIQYVYIVQDIKADRRGTIRGVLAAVAALAGMLVAVVRKRSLNWRSLYFWGIIAVAAVIIIVMFLMPKDAGRETEKKKRVKTNFKMTSVKEIMPYLLPLFVWGVGVSGVTFYNEPITSMTLKKESDIQLALIIQPVITTITTLVSGYLSDKLSRKKVILADIIIALTGTVIFVIAGLCKINNPVLMGIGWGIMIGGFFGATNLMLLVVTENAPADKIGRVSALSSYFNGAGTAVGMVLISILGNIFGTGISKLLIIVLVTVVTLAVIIFQKKAS